MHDTKDLFDETCGDLRVPEVGHGVHKDSAWLFEAVGFTQFMRFELNILRGMFSRPWA